MSLVVLSNLQGEYDVENGRTGDNFTMYNSAPGLSKAHAFQNHINPPMRIPANSEVALQSIKLNRSGNYVLPYDKTFALYIGEEIQRNYGQSDNASDGAVYENRSLSGVVDDVYRGTTSMPFIATIRKGTYTPQQMALELDRCFKRSIGHPDCYLTTNVCEQDDSNENGSGFQFGWTWQGDQSAVNRVVGGALVDATITGRTSLANVSSGAGGGTGTDMRLDTTLSRVTKISATSDFDEASSCGIQTYPISLFKGNYSVNLQNCETGWRIGFVRPWATDGRERPTWFNGAPEDFYDVMVEWSQTGLETEKSIKMFQACWDRGFEAMYMRELEYWDSALTGVVTGKLTESNPGAATFDLIEWQFQGEAIWCQITDSKAGTHVINDTTGAFAAGETIKKATQFKPIGQTCWTLYPAFSIPTQNEYAQIITYSGLLSGVYPPDVAGTAIALPNWVTPSQVADTYFYPPPDVPGASQSTTGQSYWMRSWVDEDARIGCLNIDSRSCYIIGDGVTQKEYVGIVKAGAKAGIGMSWGIITQPTNKGYDTTIPAQYTAPNIDDVGGLMGLMGSGAFTSSWMGQIYDRDTAGTARNFLTEGGQFSWWIMPSFDRPTITSGSLFVRCPTLTHQSFNMGKGIPSKIIYQIPRFSVADNNAGRVGAGELYFEPSEMTYLDLNNVDELVFNDLKIELVDKNEQYARDLTGATTLVLHFREKKNR